MDALYFYNRMMNYDKESRETGKYCYNFDNGIVNIHHIGEEDIWYTIYRDRTVHKHCFNRTFHGVKLTIDDLLGDDFEIFNDIRVFKSGYLLIKPSESNNDIMETITSLFNHIESIECDCDDIPEDKKVPYLVGCISFYRGLTDNFTFHTSNHIEVEIRTIQNFSRENVERKYYGMKAIPFIKDIKSDQAIHVDFSTFANEDTNSIRFECDKSLEELLKYMNDIGVKCTWKECKLNKPVYL